MSKALLAIAAALGVAALKNGISGSSAKNTGDHDVGKTGNKTMDVFEGSKPKIWFSLHLEDMSHPSDDKRIRDILNIQHTMLYRVVTDSIRAGLTMKEFMNLHRDQNIQKKYYEYLLSKKHNLSQKYKDETRQRVLEDVDYMRESMLSSAATAHSIIMHWAWLHDGSNTVVLGPNMQAMFENTGLQEILLDDIKMPYNSVYVALPGFDGKFLDYQSGYHDIRGVFIAKMPENLRNDGNLGYAVSIWGKPKDNTGISGYDDAFLWSGVDNVAGENIEQFLRRTYEDSKERKQPQECVEDLIRAAKIAFNVIMYWSTLKNEEDWLHPDTIEKLNKIKELEERAKNSGKRKTKEGLQTTINDIKKRISQSGKFFWIERGDESFSKDGDPQNPRGPLEKERKSPRTHIRKGHHRILNKGEDNEKIIWIEPMMVGSRIAPRFWKSLLEKTGSKNEEPEFSVVRVEKKKAGWNATHIMKSFQRTGIAPHLGGGHDPNKVVGLAITIEGDDPIALQRYEQGGMFAQSVARQNGLSQPFMTFRNVYQSRKINGKWEAIWDAR